jgi:fructose-1,6-bisphosphatase/sedoheptulose 1,7-bisphosphatase-like protein
MPDVKRADLISARKLPDMVDKAVDMALQRIAVKPGKNSVITKWELIGRRVKLFADGEALASEVSKGMAEQGLDVEPAVLKIDKWILAGFFERINLPIERQF